ncbi:MAG: EVE domain-containing protein [Rhizobiales bacterium]|nr:EVE domain-containing protein [Hyphomicrobiales bacterium]MBI3671840.1 EVE domain-containing protein [Hyphomicrobiales bacterium]
MAHWLFKSEPDVFSWEMLLAKGKTGEEWSGIRNYQARNNMRAMKLGDKGFFYYSNQGKAIVGIVEVCKLAHRDSTSHVDSWDCVDIRAASGLPKPVSLETIKTDRRLADMVLVKNSRLSVQPVTSEEWEIVCALGGVKA